MRSAYELFIDDEVSLKPKVGVDPTHLMPTMGQSYRPYKALQPACDLALAWDFKKARAHLISVQKNTASSDNLHFLALMFEVELLLHYFQMRTAQRKLQTAFRLRPQDPQVLMLLALLAWQAEAPAAQQNYQEKLQAAKQPLGQWLSAFIQSLNANWQTTSYENEIPQDQAPAAILVYGHRFEADGRMSRMLKERLEKTRALAEKYPQAQLILSGAAAQTPIEEAEAMTDWLVKRGIDQKRCWQDRYAKDTVGNNLGFVRILKAGFPRARTVWALTSLSHLARSLTGLRWAIVQAHLPIQAYGLAPESPKPLNFPWYEDVYYALTIFRSAGMLDRWAYTNKP